MARIKITRSSAKNKKYTALIKYNDDQKKPVIRHFGAKGMDDFVGTDGNKATLQQRENYRNRHKSGATAKFDTPNALSYYILWGDSTSINKNIADFKKRYNLKSL